MDDIFVHILSMDPLVREHVISNPDGTYTIFINDCLSHDRKLEAYAHALLHIKKGDFDRNIDVDAIESEAHCAFG